MSPLETSAPPRAESAAEPQPGPSENAVDLRRVPLSPDFWYPLARSRELRPGQTLAVRYAGQKIVLVRPSKASGGEVFALEDRCAHRQVPLSEGVVCENALRCGYHGWTYGPDGRCLSIPYEDVACGAPAGVRGYPCREAYGLIFVFPGEAERAVTTPLPEVPAFADPRYKVRTLDRTIDCHYSFMHENLMDMNHQFLHRRLMGSIQTIYLGMDEGPGWVEARYRFQRQAGRQSLGEGSILGAKKDGTSERPTDCMTIRTGYPYQTLQFWPQGADRPALDLWEVPVPLDAEQRTNRTLGLMAIQKPGIPLLIHLLWPLIVWFTEGIFEEDQQIVEAEQRAWDEQGRDQNYEINPPILALRRLLRAQGQT